MDTATALSPLTLTSTAPEATRDTPSLQNADTETNNVRRHHMRIEATARHATLLRSTKLQALAEKDERATAGYSGREGYVAWTQEARDSVRDALDGETVALTISKLHATKKGNRVLVSGVTCTAGHVVAIRGEATVTDTVTDPTGAVVQVKLTAKRGERKNGSPFTGFTGESVGASSTGQRIGLKCHVDASRHVRISAASL